MHHRLLMMFLLVTYAVKGYEAMLCYYQPDHYQGHIITVPIDYESSSF